MSSIRVVAAQINPTVGDLEVNASSAITAIEEAAAGGADLVLLPELAITGYPPEDLLFKEGFIEDASAALGRVVAATPPACAAVIGAVLPADALGAEMLIVPADASSRGLVNGAVVATGGRVVGTVAKRLLPNYAVFDEQRWFRSGTGPHQLFRVAGCIIGIAVCEDLWRADGPAAALAGQGAQLIVSINASPYSIRQQEDRRQILSERVAETGCAIAYVNQVGGQDELVFDGGSMIVGDDGRLLGRAPTFVEHLLVADIELHGSSEEVTEGLVEISGHSRRPGPADELDIWPMRPVEEEVYDALVLGTRDYLSKNGFSEAVIGISGGIDSALVAAIAVDAIGSTAVRGISMPSRYSSDHSRSDAEDLALRLGIRLDTVAIEPAHVAFSSMLAGLLGDEPAGLTDENLQSRLRGVLLMAISNDTGAIVLTTGNKSEMATGYSTLYGDSAGGFAVIKDVPKTMVYDLCRYRNEVAAARGESPPIPNAIITKAPSAELRPEQLDEDSLPPYELLDPILAAYVEDDRTVLDLIAAGHDAALVERVARLVDRAEYKRRQMPPGVRITTKAFGKDRRMPITSRYRSTPLQ